mmetsp:Transcript_27887/g.58907  ORF Transcript_27887/g.58907 Transcript_27887/m.58907 type:complete len:384 (+) Transcript_27887:113-1264(+)
MAKKRKSKSGSSAATNSASASASTNEEEQQLHQKESINHDGSDSDDSSSSDDDSLVLEGVLIRNPDASDSDDDDDDEISSEEEEEPTKKKAKKPNLKTDTTKSKGGKNTNTNKNQNAKKQKSQNEPEMIQVEFLFCDMNERFFHGMKTLLHRFSIHAPHSSQLADLIIENEMVGTVLSSDIDEEKKPSSKKSTNTAAAASLPLQQEANVFGFASIINVTTNHSSPCIQALKSLCLKYCPTQHKAEMETVLSGKTKRPAGFFFQERMVNVPLEITEVLHQQLVLDMDHAVATADDEAERKSLDFGAFVRLAPCYKGEGGGTANSVIYKYFDDEVFSTNAEFVYNFEAPKNYEGDEEELWCSVIVLTKTGHRAAMKDLKKMIHVG